MEPNNNAVAKLLFRNFDLNDEEKSFIIKLDQDCFTPMNEHNANTLLTQLYIAKLSEQSSKKAEKSNNVISRLTWVLAISASLQVIAVFISLIINN